MLPLEYMKYLLQHEFVPGECETLQQKIWRLYAPKYKPSSSPKTYEITFSSDAEKFQWLVANGTKDKSLRQWMADYILSEDYLKSTQGK